MHKEVLLFPRITLYKEIIIYFYLECSRFFKLFLYLLNGMRTNLATNLDIKVILTRFRLSNFSFFSLNQKVILLIGKDKINSFNNFLQIAYNFAYFSSLLN